MANHRPAVPIATRRLLIEQAGFKCANPGCANRLVDLHHIDAWAVYATHDQASMIAICPTCHGHVHRGHLRIDDDALRRWKNVARPPSDRDLVYVEPAPDARMLLGTIGVAGPAGLRVFRLASGQELAFAVTDLDVFLLNIRLVDTCGNEVLRVVDGHVRRAADPLLRYDSHPGRIRVAAPSTPRFVPRWVVEGMQKAEPDFAQSEEVALVDIEVLEPGVVQISGIWVDTDRAFVITRRRLVAIRRGPPVSAIALIGEGLDSCLYSVQPVAAALFGL